MKFNCKKSYISSNILLIKLIYYYDIHFNNNGLL